MTELERAVEADKNCEYIRAEELYRELLNGNISDEDRVEASLNLACLYFEFSDFGFATGYGIPKSLQAKGWPEALAILSEIQRLYPDHPDAFYWYEHVKTIYSDAPSDPGIWEELKTRFPNSDLITYGTMVFGNNHLKNTTLNTVLKTLPPEGTARQNYLRSYLESCILHRF